MKAALVFLACSGCAQLLGLDNTKFDYKDAMIDAPSACDGAPACVSTTGRSVCGQLFAAGAMGGQLLRVASPTGATCTGTDGPCALAVFGQSEASFFAGTTTDRITGTIDDCGRFVVPDLPATDADVAVVFTGASYATTASLLVGRMTMPGVDRGLPAYGVLATTVTDWGTQASASISAGYLVTEADANGVPQAMEEVWVNGGPVSGPPTPPWSAYFGGGKPFGTLDTTATLTDASGSSLVVPSGTASFMLGGKRTGKTCGQIAVQPVANTLIHVTLGC